MISPPRPKIKGIPPRLIAIFDDVMDWAEKGFPIEGPGIFVDSTASGRVVKAKGANGRSAASSGFPFEIRSRNNPDSGQPEYGVRYESSLYKSLKPGDKQTITGLISEDDSTGWFSLDPSGTDAIWLGIVFDGSMAITTAEINSWGQGGDFDIGAYAWAGSNGYCEDDGGSPPAFQTARILLAYSYLGTDSQPVIVQAVDTDLVLRAVNIDSRPALYPFPHVGGYQL